MKKGCANFEVSEASRCKAISDNLKLAKTAEKNKFVRIFRSRPQFAVGMTYQYYYFLSNYA